MNIGDRSQDGAFGTRSPLFTAASKELLRSLVTIRWPVTKVCILRRAGEPGRMPAERRKTRTASDCGRMLAGSSGCPPPTATRNDVIPSATRTVLASVEKTCPAPGRVDAVQSRRYTPCDPMAARGTLPRSMARSGMAADPFPSWLYLQSRGPRTETISRVTSDAAGTLDQLHGNTA